MNASVRNSWVGRHRLAVLIWGATTVVLAGSWHRGSSLSHTVALAAAWLTVPLAWHARRVGPRSRWGFAAVLTSLVWLGITLVNLSPLT
ncbi:MAG: hypothetical protein U0Y82_03430 [Thermoleophilia bacterium]